MNLDGLTVEEKEMVIDGTALMLQLFSSFSPKELYVTKGRFMEGRTLQSLADGMGCNRERIRQIEQKALRKLRHPLKATLFYEYRSLLVNSCAEWPTIEIEPSLSSPKERIKRKARNRRKYSNKRFRTFDRYYTFGREKFVQIVRGITNAGFAKIRVGVYRKTTRSKVRILETCNHLWDEDKFILVAKTQ